MKIWKITILEFDGKTEAGETAAMQVKYVIG
jgi:hypothetical protein